MNALRILVHVKKGNKRMTRRGGLRQAEVGMKCIIYASVNLQEQDWAKESDIHITSYSVLGARIDMEDIGCKVGFPQGTSKRPLNIEV